MFIKNSILFLFTFGETRYRADYKVGKKECSGNGSYSYRMWCRN